MDPLIDILIVEDNPHDVLFIKQAINEVGLLLNVKHIQNGADAIDYFNNLTASSGIPPRLILSDIRMPKMDGYEFMQYIKGNDKLRDVPLVVVSTSEQDADIERSYRLGANSYLIKPMDVTIFIDTLVRVFRYWLGVNQPPREEHTREAFMRFSTAA
ncbi:MAG: response regulator [Bacteroidetes bacterium]|nr:response regulator [Bacteroidota bacterium]MBS1685080.1 response regulator [Bacteroidota bacterium]